MHPLQAMVNGMSAQWTRERAETQMTLGKLIAALEVMPDDTHVANLCEPDSYRGYYSDLYFERHDGTRPVSELLAECKAAMGQVFTGYKGGDYMMGALTPLWIATYGCVGQKLMAVRADGEVETAEDELLGENEMNNDELLKRAEAHGAYVFRETHAHYYEMCLGTWDTIFTPAQLQAFLDSETAALNNAIAHYKNDQFVAKAEKEILQRQVSVLRDALNNQLNDCINYDGGKLTLGFMEDSTKALNATTETAQAYENRVKAEALEGAAKWFESFSYNELNAHGEVFDTAENKLRRMASELRAQPTKGE